MSTWLLACDLFLSNLLNMLLSAAGITNWLVCPEAYKTYSLVCGLGVLVCCLGCQHFQFQPVVILDLALGM